jgi:hypothetical protein
MEAQEVCQQLVHINYSCPPQDKVGVLGLFSDVSSLMPKFFLGSLTSIGNRNVNPFGNHHILAPKNYYYTSDLSFRGADTIAIRFHPKCAFN